MWKGQGYKEELYYVLLNSYHVTVRRGKEMLDSESFKDICEFLIK